jgi:type IV pilus assembly protein PilB
MVKEKLITASQLQECLDVQTQQKKYEPLGQICVKKRFITRHALNSFLKKYKKSLSLGDLLLNLGLITKNQLDLSVELQKTTGKRLGNILVDHGFIADVALINALSIQLGIPKIQPDPKIINRDLLSQIKTDFLRKRNVLPAYRGDNCVVVIMGDPLDQSTINDLRNIYKCDIDPAIASFRDITNAINLIHGFEGEDMSARSHEKKLQLGEELDAEGNAEIVDIVNFIISQAIVEKASDIHIEPMEERLRIRYRVDGVMHHKTDFPIFLNLMIAARIKALCNLDTIDRKRPQDGRIRTKFMDRVLDLRISTYVGVYGENIVIRVLDQAATRLELDQLGFSPVNFKHFGDILDQPSGIILVTGPTGCGKSTTLYACLNYLNTMDKTIITVEDPVEYSVDGIVQANYTPKLGITYNDYIKSMMRQDPDIIMVGEVRDASAAEAVIQCSLTGHKVLTTFHTEDSCGALLRLMDMGINTFLISSTVVSVVAQRLIRTLCKYCKEPSTPAPAIVEAFNVRPEGLEKYQFYRESGCAHCNYTGYSGRMGIHEHMILNEPLRDAILARQTSSQIRVVARNVNNMITMHEDGFYKAALGQTTLEEIMRVAFLTKHQGLSPRSIDDIVELSEKTGDIL